MAKEREQGKFYEAIRESLIDSATVEERNGEKNKLSECENRPLINLVF